MAAITTRIKKTLFVKSFNTFKPRYINSVLIDFVSILIFIGILALYYFMFASITNRIFFVYRSDILYLVCLILISALAWILFTVNTAFFKRLSYKLMFKKTESFKTWFMHTLFWYIPWFVLFAFALVAMRETFQGVVLVVLLILYVVLTSVTRLKMQKKFRKTIKISVDTLLKLKHLILPYLLMLVIFALVFVVSGWFYKISVSIYVPLLIILLLFYITWSRYYMSLVVNKIK